jgi:hypothetical protein
VGTIRPTACTARDAGAQYATEKPPGAHAVFAVPEGCLLSGHRPDLYLDYWHKSAAGQRWNITKWASVLRVWHSMPNAEQEMSGMIWYLIKFFAEESHADQFLQGELFLNRLSYFKKLESASADGRPDAHEAVAMLWQPHDLVIDLNIPGIGKVKITKDDLAAPVSTSFDFHNHLHIFCMYAVQTVGFTLVDGKIDCSAEKAGALQKQLEIDERCLNFGKLAVIVQARPFMDQVTKAATGRYRLRAKSVKYYDETTLHGEIKPEDIPFSKQKRFEHQKEFRICVNTGTTGDSPLTMHIGDIRRIAAKVESSRLNDLLELKLEPAPIA